MSPIACEPKVREERSDLIWETDGQCIVQAGEVALPAGEDEAWTPDLFVAVGLAASVMSAFFRLAAGKGLNVLGYASQQRIDRSMDSQRSQIIVAPCITVGTDEEATLARAIFDRAVAESPLTSVLRCPLRFEPHVVALRHESIGCDC